MNKKRLNGVFRLNTSAGQAFAVYVRLGSVQEVSDPGLKRFVGQPFKTLVRWLENQTKDIPWETVSIEDAYSDEPTSVGGLAVELGLYPGENQPCQNASSREPSQNTTDKGLLTP